MTSFWGEMKRRNVVRVAVAYVIVGWLILQFADVLIPLLTLPEWVGRLNFLLLLVGFPLALFFAWAYELTPEGLKKEKDVDRTESIAHLTGRKLDFIIIGVLVVAVGFLLVDKIYLSEGDRAPDEIIATERQSIAVLPFVNMSEDPSQEHFADGLTEELLNTLAKLSDLRVISRTSSFVFKERNVPISEIAAALQVDHILEGSVRRAGNTIRITAQLIATSSDSHLWSNSYDRELNLDNILEIQEEIAVTVVDELNLRLLPQDSRMIVMNGPANLNALDFYHDGMFYLRKAEIGEADTETTFKPAVQSFEASIAADPNWAPPRAALGRVIHFFKEVGDMAENLRISKGHIMDAIRLDNAYGPAYGSLGYILSIQGDFDGSMRAYERARSLGTDSSWGKAILLGFVGRFDAAIDEYLQAVTHDPLSTHVRYQLMGAYACAGRYAEAIDAASTLLATEPDDENLRIILANTYLRSGNMAAGLQMADDVAKDIGTDLPFAATFAMVGRDERARAALNAPEMSEPGASFDAAIIAAALGQDDRALTRLEQAVDFESARYRAVQLLYRIQCSPEFRSLVGNARYEALLNRLGLPD